MPERMDKQIYDDHKRLKKKLARVTQGRYLLKNHCQLGNYHSIGL